MRAVCLLAALISLGSAPHAFARSRVLIPIAIHDELHGAYGSIWITEFVVRNSSSRDIWLQEIPYCTQVCKGVRAGATGPFSLEPLFQGAPVFLFMADDDLESLSFNLRTRDISRASSGWGTELPVIRSDELLSGRVDLLNIPIDSRYRQALRIFGGDEDFEGAQIRVRIFSLPGEELLVDTVTSLGGVPKGSSTPPFAFFLFLANDFPQLQQHPAVRIQLDAFDPELRYWALVTVGNNETQQVTTITPQ